jgi:hypothetical protein
MFFETYTIAGFITDQLFRAESVAIRALSGTKMNFSTVVFVFMTHHVSSNFYPALLPFQVYTIRWATTVGNFAQVS